MNTSPDSSLRNSLKNRVSEMERAEILDALRRAGWVKAKAARLLGITERMIGYKIQKYGIKKEVRYSEGAEEARRADGIPEQYK